MDGRYGGATDSRWRKHPELGDGGVGGGSFRLFQRGPRRATGDEFNGGGVALKEVVDMAALGRIETLVVRYPLSAVKQPYDDFEQGHLVARAVVIAEASATRAA